MTTSGSKLGHASAPAHAASAITVRQRGLTLIELLLVIALLLAVSAIVAPAMVGTLRDRALDSAADVAAEQLMLARAHAQSSGRPVEVAYHDDPSRIVVRYFRAGIDSIDEGDRRAAVLRGEEDAFAGAERTRVQASDDNALTWNWARRVLPGGVQMRSVPPEDSAEREMFARSRSNGNERPQEPRRVRLAVFMPDGSALLGSPVWLEGENGRSLKLMINLWTGLPSVEAHEPVNDRREDTTLERAFP